LVSVPDTPGANFATVWISIDVDQSMFLQIFRIQEGFAASRTSVLALSRSIGHVFFLTHAIISNNAGGSFWQPVIITFFKQIEQSNITWQKIIIIIIKPLSKGHVIPVPPVPEVTVLAPYRNRTGITSIYRYHINVPL
jgi:hypothetical protein